MTHIDFWMALLLITPMWILIRWRLYVKSPAAFDPAREMLVNLLLLYLLMLLYITVFPVVLNSHSVTREFNWSLFTRLRYLMHEPHVAFMNIVGNIVMFVPLAILVPLLYRFTRNGLAIVLLGAAVSFGIELVQYRFGFRAADIDDVVLNTFGALLGYVLYRVGAVGSR